ncbi:ATP-binding protein [Pseudalkalibacillus sp. JSM 102089]|uniref:ATP-binding protein n=1 Tax=Pseudalkalibacillus sp. JSM 102089 TaxID=3229856 RepID=UPI0035242203
MCLNREAFNYYQERSLAQRKLSIQERLTREYYYKGYEDVFHFKKILDSNNMTHNLLIMGNPGTGKTHLCVPVASTHRDSGYTGGFLTTGQLLAKVKPTYNNASINTEKAVISDLNEVDILILDDLGSEAMGGNEDWRKTMIFEVV